MKNLITLFLSISCFVTTFSQNWQPVVNGNQYNFGKSDEDVLSEFLEVDSINIVINQTRYYLNQILSHTPLLNDAQCVNAIARVTAPFFFSDYYFLENDTVFFVKGSRNLVFPLIISIDDEWIWNTETQATAKLISEFDTTLWNIEETVRHIQTDDGYQYWIGQTIGIIQFSKTDQTFQLQGMQNLNLGRTVPTMDEILDIEPGTILYYRSSFIYSGPEISLRYYRMKFIDRTTEGDNVNMRYYIFPNNGTDSIVYFKYELTNFCSPRYYDYFHHYYNTTNFCAKGNDGENNMPWHSGFFITEWGPLDLKQLHKSYSEPLWGNQTLGYNVISKSTNSSFPFYNADLSFIQCEPESNLAVYSDFEGFFSYKMAKGLGFVFGSINLFENKTGSGQTVRYLTGYIKSNGDTLGEVAPDSVLLMFNGTEEMLSNKNVFKIFPNPTNTELNMVLDDLSANFNIEIYDLKGKMIHSARNLNSQYVYNTSSLKEGTYIAKIISHNQVSVHKIVVSH